MISFDKEIRRNRHKDKSHLLSLVVKKMIIFQNNFPSFWDDSFQNKFSSFWYPRCLYILLGFGEHNISQSVLLCAQLFTLAFSQNKTYTSLQYIINNVNMANDEMSNVFTNFLSIKTFVLNHKQGRPPFWPLLRMQLH